MKLTGIIAEKLATLIETQGGTIADQITKKVCGLLSDEIPGVVHRLTDTVSKEVGKNIQDKKFSEQMAKNLRETLVAEQSSYLSGFKRTVKSIGKSLDDKMQGLNSSNYDQDMVFSDIKDKVITALKLEAGALAHFNQITTGMDGDNWKKVLEQVQKNSEFDKDGVKGSLSTKENILLAFKAAVAEKTKAKAAAEANKKEGVVANGGNANIHSDTYTKRGRNATSHHSARGKMYNRTRKYPRKQKSRRKQNNRKSV